MHLEWYFYTFIKIKEEIKRKSIKNIFLVSSILFALSLISVNTACSSQKQAQKSVSNRLDKLADQKEDKKQQSEKEREEQRQKHIDMQTKKVQKRMKKSRKKAKKYNSHKDDSFLKRWFGGK